eukprot:1007918-Amphidinium_carterae.2
MEAAATALILKMCLSPLLLHESEKIPQPMVCGELDDLPKAPRCTESVFNRSAAARLLTLFRCTDLGCCSECQRTVCCHKHDRCWHFRFLSSSHSLRYLVESCGVVGLQVGACLLSRQ